MAQLPKSYWESIGKGCGGPKLVASVVHGGLCAHCTAWTRIKCVRWRQFDLPEYAARHVDESWELPRESVLRIREWIAWAAAREKVPNNGWRSLLVCLFALSLRSAGQPFRRRNLISTIPFWMRRRNSFAGPGPSVSRPSTNHRVPRPLGSSKQRLSLEKLLAGLLVAALTSRLGFYFLQLRDVERRGALPSLPFILIPFALDFVP
ncbi:hypothetical protein IQ07DRAFT_345660 [Pyrenochaeta sp. DS3sAY3a]|nr:hypothetical protein IQ07DRAFT_345660 [Pyrenochaeta sp. DS3sAY3a]